MFYGCDKTPPGTVDDSSTPPFLVSANLNVSNICQVLDVSDLYNDVILKRICLKFVQKNYDETLLSIIFVNY